MTRPPTKSNNNSKQLYAIGTTLEKTLGIPAPRLLKACSRYVDAYDMAYALVDIWAPSASGNPENEDRLAISATRERFLTDLLNSDPSTLPDVLSSLPSDINDSECHTTWAELLTPDSDVMATNRSEHGTRHVLRLAFNSGLVKAVVDWHLHKYARLLCPTSAGPSRAVYDGYQSWQRQYVDGRVRARSINSVLRVSNYKLRYDTTKVFGWTRGPDHRPSNEDGAACSFDQLFGNTSRLMEFLSSAAQHCHACPVQFMGDGTGCIQFVHEAQYRHELYDLRGTTSPAHRHHSAAAAAVPAVPQAAGAGLQRVREARPQRPQLHAVPSAPQRRGGNGRRRRRGGGDKGVQEVLQHRARGLRTCLRRSSRASPATPPATRPSPACSTAPRGCRSHRRRHPSRRTLVLSPS